MLKVFLFGSIRKSLLFIVLLALLPAFGIIVYSSLDTHRRAFAHSLKKAGQMVADVAAQCSRLESSVHGLLSSLARFEEVRRKKAGEVKTLFLALLRHSSGYDNFLLLDAQGDLVASGLPGEEVSPADLLACDLARREGRFVVDGSRTERGETILFFAVPVADEEGEILGAIGGGIRLNLYLEGIVAGNLESGERIRFHTAGSLLSYPDEDLPPQALAGEWKGIRDSGLSRG
ncbi:MAG: cache domain-containing protein, partial [Desulfovibrio sp.]|nr:cache domain-containing protein [Desulfovibrio sp.]